MRKAFLLGEDNNKRIEEIRMVVEASAVTDDEEEIALLTDFIVLIMNYIIDTSSERMWTESYLVQYVLIALTNEENGKVSKLQKAINNRAKLDGAKEFYNNYSDLLDRINNEMVMKALAVLKWDAINNCTNKDEKAFTLSKIPEVDRSINEPAKQWRVIMNEINEADDNDQVANLIMELVTECQKETLVMADARKAQSLLFAVYYYLRTFRPYAEQTYENVIKLIGASKRPDRAIISPFGKIIEQIYRLDTNNDIIKTIRKRLKNINNCDVDETLELMRYDVMKKNPVDKEEVLGFISLMKHYLEESVTLQHIDSYEMNRGSEKISKELKVQFEEFAKKYTPQKIKTYLDEYIIGQASAKINVASAVYNHVLRGLYPEEKLNKANVLLIGPSGCGKTEIVRRLKEMLKEENIDIPVVISDFSGVVATPWKGRNKEEVLARLFEEAKQDLDKAQHGIVFLDEFDKIVPKVAGGARGYDYNSELQGQMLGMLEGTSCQVKVTIQNGDSESVANILMKTDNILFILAGAFEGLDEIIRKNQRANMTSSFGLVTNKKSHIDFTDKNVSIDNLMDYGIRAELAGRIGYVSVLKPLDKSDMLRILKEAKDNIITRYQNAMFAEDGIELSFEDDAYDALADQVEEFGIGARGLNAILHEVLADIMFEAPSKTGTQKVIITGDVVNGNADATYLP